MALNSNNRQEIEDVLRKMDIEPENITELKVTEADADVERIGLDGLDGVSGGIYGVKKWAPDDWQNPVWGNMTWIEGADFIEAIYNAFGEDVAIAYCIETFCKSKDWERYIHANGPRYAAYYMWSICYSVA